MAIASVATHAWELLLMGLLLLCSGFFSGTETALFNLSRGQLHRLQHSRHGAGRLVASLMARPRRILNTLLLGNMIVNVAFAGTSAMVVLAMEQSGVSAWAVGAAALASLLGLILIGEVAPKMLAYAVGERWALVAARILAVIERIFAPPLWVFEGLFITPLARMIAPRKRARLAVTPDELAAVIDLSAKRGIIDRDVNAVLQEIVTLSDLRVSDTMVPRVDVVAYSVDAPAEGLMDLFRRTHLRRIPVYEGNLDRILGVVHAKRLLLGPGQPLRQLVAKVPFVPETANLERVLLQLRVKRSQLAIVVDEYGGTAGLITLEDVIEEIVGDIRDPLEKPTGPAVEQLGERQYRIDGDLAIHEWAEAFKIDLSGQRISTLGGFVTSLLGRIPREGDRAEYSNLRFVVESMRGRRVGKLRVELHEEPRPSEGNEA